MTLTRRIRASVERVYAALVTPELILRWWSPDAGPTLYADVDARVGGHLRVAFQMMDGTLGEVRGTYQEVHPPDRLVFTFAWATEPERESLVTITLRPIEPARTQDPSTGTELTLTHSGLDDRSSEDAHADGWAATLDNLVTHLHTVRRQVADQHTPEQTPEQTAEQARG